ncbi:hypothetical protein LINPERHAP2_LOCUS3744 [Linum perenne]
MGVNIDWWPNQVTEKERELIPQQLIRIKRRKEYYCRPRIPQLALLELKIEKPQIALNAATPGFAIRHRRCNTDELSNQYP